MTSFILIVVLSAWGSDGGNAMTTAEFASKEACEQASVAATRLADGLYGRRIRTVCVEKDVRR